MSINFNFASNPGNYLNVSNANGYAIQRMLGLDPYFAGDIDPRDLLVKLTYANPSEIVSDPTDNHGVSIDADGVTPVVRSIDFGLRKDQVQHYCDCLQQLAEGAIEAGEEIYWG